MKNLFNFLLGAILGAAIGSLIAMLFAPTSGSQLRSQIVDYRTNLENEVRQAAHQRRSELEAELQHLRSGGSLKLE